MDSFRPNLKIILICIALFFFFLVLRFPYQNFRGYLFGEIYKNTKILIVAEDIYPSFFGWPGVGIKKVDVTLPLGGSELELSADKVIARVGLGGLIPPIPSFSLAMRDLKKGGDLDISFTQSEPIINAGIEADDVQLEQLKFSALPQAITGNLNADSDLEIDVNDLSKSKGEIDLSVDNFKLPTISIQLSPVYGFVIPAMKVGQLKARVQLKNGVAEITQFQFGEKGSDITGSITGDVKLGRDILSSSANILVRLDFSDQIKNSSQAVTLLSFLNTFKSQKTGSFAIKCNRPFRDAAACLLLPEPVPD